MFFQLYPPSQVECSFVCLCCSAIMLVSQVSQVGCACQVKYSYALVMNCMLCIFNLICVALLVLYTFKCLNVNV